MRKTAVVLILVLLAGSAAYAAGPFGMSALGVYGSLGTSTTGATGGGLGLTMKWGGFPVVGVQYNFAANAARIGASLDYYVVDAQGLAGPLSWYLGVGAYGGIALADTIDGDIGLRLPIGLQIWPVRKLEIFLAGIPLVKLLPSVGMGFGGELGIRVHF